MGWIGNKLDGSDTVYYEYLYKNGRKAERYAAFVRDFHKSRFGCFPLFLHGLKPQTHKILAMGTAVAYDFYVLRHRRNNKIFLVFGCELHELKDWTPKLMKELAKKHHERSGALWTSRAVEFAKMITEIS